MDVGVRMSVRPLSSLTRARDLGRRALHRGRGVVDRQLLAPVCLRYEL